MFESSPNQSTSFFSHLQKWDRSYLYKRYCPNNVLGELKACYSNHPSTFLQEDCPFLLGLQGPTIHFHSKLTVNGFVTFLPLTIQTSIPPFENLEWIFFKKASQKVCTSTHFQASSQSCFKIVIKKYVQALIFKHHLKVVLRLSSHSIEILCKPKLECLTFYLPNHPIFQNGL